MGKLVWTTPAFTVTRGAPKAGSVVNVSDNPVPVSGTTHSTTQPQTRTQTPWAASMSSGPWTSTGVPLLRWVALPAAEGSPGWAKRSQPIPTASWVSPSSGEHWLRVCRPEDGEILLLLARYLAERAVIPFRNGEAQREGSRCRIPPCHYGPFPSAVMRYQLFGLALRHFLDGVHAPKAIAQ